MLSLSGGVLTGERWKKVRPREIREEGSDLLDTFSRGRKLPDTLLSDRRRDNVALKGEVMTAY